MKKLLITFIFLAICVIANAGDSAPTGNRSDWMKNLRDDVPIWKLCMPGVHDAATGRTHFYGASVQTKDILELFDIGVRVFDIRVGFTNGIELRIYHGPFDMARTFEGVMDDLYKSISEHKSEFVIAIINRESAPTQESNCLLHLKSYFNRTYTSNPEVKHHYWDNKTEHDTITAKWLEFRPDLTVGEARGHILFLFRDEFCETKDLAGALLGNFPSFPGVDVITYYDSKTKEVKTTPFLCQDACNHDRFEKKLISKFLDFVQPCMRMFKEYIDRDKIVWCINHLSGYTSDPVYPNSAILASAVNREFAKYLASNPNAPTGMVMMDYAGEMTCWGYTVCGDLALEAVIHQNWPYWQIPTDYKQRLDPVEIPTH